MPSVSVSLVLRNVTALLSHTLMATIKLVHSAGYRGKMPLPRE
jgi:hypothetical protein